jgi:predicted alpha/beta-hydrolase family hydrolase
MGGRIASQVVAQGEAVAGLVLFAYPLHPPGRPEQRRDAHLASISVPVLFLSGTRDTFATPDELDVAAALIDGARVRLLAGADHGFNVLKASGRSRAEVWAEATAALLAFIESVPA